MKYSWIVHEGTHLQSSESNQRRNLSNMESRTMQITIKPTRKPKRFRSAFSTEQISFLEQQFKKFPYISTEHRKEIATALNMEERAIKIWFQNRRMKEKKELINKELDNETTTKVYYDPNRLLNVCTLPSTNEQVSYSLPIIMKPAVDTHTTQIYEANNDSVLRGTRDQAKAKTQQVPQNLSTSHLKAPLIPSRVLIKSHITPTSIPKYDLTQKCAMPKGQFKNKFPPINKKSAELSMSKKLKKAGNHLVNPDNKAKLHRKFEPGHPATTAKIKAAPEDLSSNKKSKTRQAFSKPPKQAKVNGPSYYPVIPTVYAHPYISSGGMIWKPVNIIPVTSAGTAVSSNHQQHFGHDQKKNCCCNCHENVQPFTVPPNPTSPYTQYVITAPFQNPNPKY